MLCKFSIDVSRISKGRGLNNIVDSGRFTERQDLWGPEEIGRNRFRLQWFPAQIRTYAKRNTDDAARIPTQRDCTPVSYFLLPRMKGEAAGEAAAAPPAGGHGGPKSHASGFHPSRK